MELYVAYTLLLALDSVPRKSMERNVLFNYAFNILDLRYIASDI